MLIRFLTWLFIIIIVYRFFKGAVKSFFNISVQNGSHLKNMQDQLNDLNKKMDNKQHDKVKKKSDYIDYEEIK